jgi:hypothetical protein
MQFTKNRFSLLSLALAGVSFMQFRVTEGESGGGEIPTGEASEAAATEAVAATPILNGKEMRYFFKTPADTVVKDDAGNEISRTKGEKHPEIKAVLPVPTAEDLVGYLAYAGETQPASDAPDAKQVPTARAKIAAFILDLVADSVKDAGKIQINEFLEKNENDPKARFSVNLFDLNKLTLEYIANLPKGQRGAWAPDDDELKAFGEVYTNVMVHEVKYDPKKVKVHVDQILKGFAKIKADKVAVDKMKSFLTVFASKVDEETMEEHERVFGWLNDRADKYLKAEEKNFADAL